MAMPAKGKEPASDTIMSPGDMKPLLALSKREPVHAAIGLTADGEGVILLNKKMKSKKVLAVLKATAAKAKIQLQPSTLRFGKAEVDTDYDAGMVRFFVNKEPPGNMRVRLLEVIKRVPYQKVELNVDASFEEEPEDETEGTETADASATAATAPQPPPAPPPASSSDATAVYAKSRLVWLAARKKVETDIETLRQRIVDTFKGDGVAPQIETSYRTKVAPVLATLDASLADTLEEVTSATDAAKRAELVQEAKAIMQKYAQYLTSEPLLKDLDENPFMPLSIRATVGATISALSKTVH